MPSLAPYDTRYAPNGMVCSVDHLASEAGVAMLRAGGSAVDAAIAANAVLAVTCQHMSGMGGDLFALVHVPGSSSGPVCLNASGRAGSGTSAAAVRKDGHEVMPRTGDIRSVTVPGCVDGWVALHSRFGRLPLGDVLEPARSYAADGFPAPVHLAGRVSMVADLPGASDFAAATRAGAIVRRAGIGRALADVAAGGREAFYEGAFGRGLIELGRGLYRQDDLARVQADWVSPLSLEAFGHRLWTVPPNSQGYLTLASASIAEGLALPSSPDDPLWPHLLVEAVRQASFDRLDVLHDAADGEWLLSSERLAERRAAISADRAADLGDSYAGGGTIYLCAVDGDRMGVSLIQSNAAGFGALLVEPTTGIFLHNRGIGFSLAKGHPAELAPGRRPPHTLSPALVTTFDGGELRMVVGTEGGDTQPQVVLQLLVRSLLHGETPGQAMAAPRFVLGPAVGNTGFDVWRGRGRVQVEVERTAPDAWVDGLAARGHAVERTSRVGLAHLISVEDDGAVLAGASEPRVLTGSASGY